MKQTSISAPICLLIICLHLVIGGSAQRARDLGIFFDGEPGPFNSITDVKNVLVGYKTIVAGEGKRQPGTGPVRTGVTVILPAGRSIKPLPAGWFCLNGDGEMTGTAVIEEYGFNFGPIGITNTNSVGVVRDAIGEWNLKHFSSGELVDFSFGLPVVAETWDGMLNDINGLHVKKEDVFAALDSASAGPTQEGNVGGGTGMSLFQYKGGSGTASRLISIDSVPYTVGAFIQGNFGRRPDLVIAGVPVGRLLEKEDLPIINTPAKDGSIIIIIGTDAPLLPAQLKMIARRAALGVARTGGIGRNGSGDLFFAFSTAGPTYNKKQTLQNWSVLPKEKLDQVYQATVQATEEAIINALVAAKTMTGIDGNRVFAIPHNKLLRALHQFNR